MVQQPEAKQVIQMDKCIRDSSLRLLATVSGEHHPTSSIPSKGKQKEFYDHQENFGPRYKNHLMYHDFSFPFMQDL